MNGFPPTMENQTWCDHGIKVSITICNACQPWSSVHGRFKPLPLIHVNSNHLYFQRCYWKMALGIKSQGVFEWKYTLLKPTYKERFCANAYKYWFHHVSLINVGTFILQYLNFHVVPCEPVWTKITEINWKALLRVYSDNPEINEIMLRQGYLKAYAGYAANFFWLASVGWWL